MDPILSATDRAHWVTPRDLAAQQEAGGEGGARRQGRGCVTPVGGTRKLNTVTFTAMWFRVGGPRSLSIGVPGGSVARGPSGALVLLPRFHSQLHHLKPLRSLNPPRLVLLKGKAELTILPTRGRRRRGDRSRVTGKCIRKE